MVWYRVWCGMVWNGGGAGSVMGVGVESDIVFHRNQLNVLQLVPLQQYSN